MYYYSSRQSGSKNKGLELHSVLKEYRKFEREKSILKNRINIMANNHLKNVKKTQTIDDHLAKIRKAKAEKKSDSVARINQITSQKMHENQLKRNKVLQIKEMEKRATLSKKMYSQHKEHRSSLIRSERSLNHNKIKKNKEEVFRQKKLRRSRIMEETQKSRVKVQMFKHKKLASLKVESIEKLEQQMFLNQYSQQELNQLKKMEKQIMVKYSQSIASFKSSRSRAGQLRA